MGDLPRVFLLHTVTLERYLSWGSYAAPAKLRCTVSEDISSRRGQAGVEQVSTVTIYAPKATVCPPGSRITLADGRVGYAVAMVRYDGGGLPTPDHVEIAVNVTVPAYAPAFGETVIIRRAGTASRDRYNNVRRSYTDVAVAGCAVRVMSSSEQASNTGDQVSTNVEVIMPPGTQVSTVDKLLVRGLLYEVNGEPLPIQDNMTGGDAGLRVIALRQTG